MSNPDFRTIGLCAVATLVLVSAGTASAQCLRQKLTPEVRQSQHGFRTVDIDGDVLVVGAFRDDASGSDAGAAYVFRFDGALWIEEDKLTAADGADGDNLCVSASIDGDTLVCGAPTSDPNGSASGSAYVFVRTEGVWSFQQKVTPEEPASSERFGESVVVDGDLLFVGAPRVEQPGGDNAGEAYIFERVEGQWTEIQSVAPDSLVTDDNFGQALAVYEDVLVVAAPGRFQVQDPGEVYVYRFDGMEWVFEQELIPADIGNFDQLGLSVAAAQDVIAIGNPFNDTGPFNGGAVHVFRFNGRGWDDEQTLVASDAGVEDLLGISVDIDGDIIAVGAYRDDHGGAGLNAGSSYAFQFDGDSWEEIYKIVPDDFGAQDEFGRSVSISGIALVSGAQLHDNDCGSNCDSGAVYVHMLDDSDDDRDEVIDACDNCATVFNPKQEDCNEDGYGDACVTPGDFIANGTVSLADHVEFVDCLAGPDLTPMHDLAACDGACLEAFDFEEADGDVDLADFAEFQIVFNP